MRICVVSQQVKKTISGIGLHTNNLIGSLLADGHNVCVIAPQEQRPDGNLPYEFIGVPTRLGFLKGNQARWIPLAWSFARALEKREVVDPFDLIHFTDARESLFYHGHLPTVGNINDTYSAELQSVGYYRRYYSDWFTRWGYYHFVHLAESFALCKLNAVLANSHFTAEVIAHQYQISQGKLFICYKSIDSGRFKPAVDQRQSLTPHPPRVLFVGTNMQRKGLPALIHAAPIVVSHFPQVEFWVVGEDKVIPKMKQICAAEGVDNKFQFLGWKSQADLISVYAQCDIFVMPSLTEALGMVFLEAMASGLAVIGTVTGGIPEIIQDGRNGFTIPPDNPEELSHAILKLLENPQFYRQVQQNGYETAERFNVRKMMDGTYQVYRKICHKKGLIAP